jgi:hypothetical protein
MLNRLKQALTVIGSYLPRKAVVEIQAFVNYIAIGRWMADRQYRFPHRLVNREAVWNEMLKIVANRRVLYLEFGVYMGSATRYWSTGLKHPEAALHGFDSFEGLPDTAGPWRQGQFDVGGQLPRIDDPRVKFFKGWFEVTLPAYGAPFHDQLVLNLDADLYASTVCIFENVGALIKPGTIIYFDEMNHIAHEPKAFAEFMKKSGRRFKPLAADRTLAHVAFQCVT